MRQRRFYSTRCEDSKADTVAATRRNRKTMFGLLLLGILTFAIPFPGTAADEFPNGCVSCHVVLGNGEDKRLVTVLDEIGHLSVKGKVAHVPADCIACHEKKHDTPLSVLIHKAHFGTPDKNVFIQRFGGDCRNCHIMDGATGKASLKQGDANW